MLKLKSDLPNASLAKKWVIVRADLNTPRANDGTIINDFRIKALLPTLDLILNKNGKIILLTHCGRPTKADPALSTHIFVEWFKKHGYQAFFAHSISAAMEAKKKSNASIIVVENMRFFPEEQKQDKTFAKQLAQLGDYYVNDAFGLAHRADTSVTLLPELFAKNKRTIGLLIEKELTLLNKLRENAKHPFVLLQGGAKGSTKIPFLKALLKKTDIVLLSTPLCFTFLAAQGQSAGNSLVEKEQFNNAKSLLNKAKEENKTIILPVDYQITTDSFEKPHTLKESKSIPDNALGVSIGPETAKLFSSYLKQARTIFLNGMPGNIEYPETLEGSRILLNSLQQTNAFCVIAGGDTLTIVEKLGFSNICHFSTGGGAALAYLSGQTLRALAVFA